MQVQLDDLDLKLISLMMDDASRTNVALARELGVSDGTVRNHIQRLLDERVMQIVAIIDPWKIGHRIQLFSGIEVDLGKLNDVAQALAECAEVTYISYTTGAFDLLMVSVFANDEELFHFLTERVSKIDGIRRISSNHVLRAVKRTFRYDQLLRNQQKTVSVASGD